MAFFFFSHCAKLLRKAVAFFHHKRSQIAIRDELFLYTKVIQYFFRPAHKAFRSPSFCIPSFLLPYISI